jgi:enterochelin esterase-like enzyme
MHRKYVFLMVWIFFVAVGVLAGSAEAQVEAVAGGGTVVEDLSMESDLLGYSVDYAVYLPPGYDKSKRSYPVVYLLHGFTDDETAWIQFGEVQAAANRGISRGEIPPMIIVMPDAGVTWYINDAAGAEPYEDMFFEEFIPHVENEYRIRSDEEFRAVSGLSMGGYGSLVWAMHRPDMFASAAAFSAGIMTDQEIVEMPVERYQEVFGELFGEGLEGQERLTGHFDQNNPLHLAETLPSEELTAVRWYIDCGDDDFLYRGNSNLHMALRAREISHEYRVRDGSHHWSYWRRNIIHGLRFIGDGFNR